MSTLCLHFEHVHFVHLNHFRHPIHQILRSLSSYNFALELTILTLESSFVKISSSVTQFKSACPLLSVVVCLVGIFLVFINLNFFFRCSLSPLHPSFLPLCRLCLSILSTSIPSTRTIVTIRSTIFFVHCRRTISC